MHITTIITIDSYSLGLAVLTAIASGMVGSFALMKRMTLAGDAFSHVALPGIGLAVLYSYSPILGGIIALLIGAFIVWKIEKDSKLNTEAVMGVLFSLSLAVGALLIKEEHELIETLFGGITPVTAYEFLFGSLIALVVIVFVLKNRRSLVLMIVSKDLAKTADINVNKLQLSFLLVFALTVILGMEFLGVLLMGSLIIVPAAAARNVAKNLSSMLIISSVLALVSVISGIFVSQLFDIQLGPVIIIVSVIMFAATLFLNSIKN